MQRRGHWTIEWILQKLNEVSGGWLRYFDTSGKLCIRNSAINTPTPGIQVIQMVERKGIQTHRMLRKRLSEKFGKALMLTGHRKVCTPAVSTCESERMKTTVKPSEGKLQARFDEGHCQWK